MFKKSFLLICIFSMILVGQCSTLIHSLTEDECKQCKSKMNCQVFDCRSFSFALDFASKDINQRLLALFVCPRKFRKSSRLEISPIKRSNKIPDQSETKDQDEDLDDFYIFWQKFPVDLVQSRSVHFNESNLHPFEIISSSLFIQRTIKQLSFE